MVDGADTLCFVCGPRSLVVDAPVLLERVGVPRTLVRVEEW
jgi:hypothetical protein